MAQLGFLGLGIMGGPMAQHLLKAGHEVALWSNTKQKAEEVAKHGKGTLCATPKQVAERSDFTFYCVGDGAMVSSIVFGKDGLIEGVRPGSVTSDCSTIAPAVSLEDRRGVRGEGAHFLDSPCTGSKPGAEGAR
jgi:3-hydroxyisobutyrate dehydrogenase-like beta-hydroxyacid dehydrogenase